MQAALLSQSNTQCRSTLGLDHDMTMMSISRCSIYTWKGSIPCYANSLLWKTPMQCPGISKFGPLAAMTPRHTVETASSAPSDQAAPSTPVLSWSSGLQICQCCDAQINLFDSVWHMAKKSMARQALMVSCSPQCIHDNHIISDVRELNSTRPACKASRRQQLAFHPGSKPSARMIHHY